MMPRHRPQRIVVTDRTIRVLEAAKRRSRLAQHRRELLQRASEASRIDPPEARVLYEAAEELKRLIEEQDAAIMAEAPEAVRGRRK